MAASIHVVGAGNLGATVASALGSLVRPPVVTLILRNQERLAQYVQNDQVLTVIKQGQGPNRKTIPAVVAGVAEGRDMQIANLVVGTKVPQTIPALTKLAPLMGRDTNVLFLQNGMGLYEKLCEQIWTNPSVRPNLIFSTSTHGVKTVLDTPFTYNHTGIGDLKVSLIPRDSSDKTEENPLVKLLVDTDLNTVPLPYSEFFIAQFEKLVVNSCMNAISAVFTAYNSEMLQLAGLDEFLFNIISENINVFKTHIARAEIPISIPQKRLDEYYFNVKANIDHIKFLMNRNATSTTSMVQDIEALRDTEIDNINGYIVSLAKQYDIPTPYNQMFISLVKSKLSLERFRRGQA
ncbi:hypothetical protein DV495_004372 [Geotrichum candidum]|nr:hypothetical protein DV452_002106 [Geotrichum candidum]KAF5121363.1 hypothetical protein DV495_004372 [Geotrichum candidum]KAI9211888.1 hypothetical protein DS838_003226 [Geotrichum bryndzae]